jgi:hypothetical protein
VQNRIALPSQAAQHAAVADLNITKGCALEIPGRGSLEPIGSGG